jgi:hypothetical protein
MPFSQNYRHLSGITSLCPWKSYHYFACPPKFDVYIYCISFALRVSARSLSKWLLIKGRRVACIMCLASPSEREAPSGGKSSRLNESVRYSRTTCEIFGPWGGDYAMHYNKYNLERCRPSDNVLFPARKCQDVGECCRQGCPAFQIISVA